MVVDVVADEFSGHVPVWFPGTIADDEDLMPVSPSLLEEFRAWNDLSVEVMGAGPAAADEHSRVGYGLCQRLARELGTGYVVRFRRLGSNPRWVWIDAAAEEAR